MSYDMDGDTYNLLYKRYLKRSPKELLELAGMKDGDVVWDLCSGSNGIVTKEAIKMGAKQVIAVDKNSKVWSLELFSKNVMVFNDDIKTFLKFEWNHKNPDVVVCRQGANYWLDKSNISLLAKKISSGSTFVFNTFGQKPSSKPSVKKYKMGNINYVEVWCLNGKTINHVQMAEGMEPHCTAFKWIHSEEFREALDPYFDVKVCQDGNSEIYVCRRLG